MSQASPRASDPAWRSWHARVGHSILFRVRGLRASVRPPSPARRSPYLLPPIPMADSLSMQDRADSLVGALQRHSKKILAAAVGLAAVAGGFYLYNASEATKGVAAERAYYQAQQSVASGNLPLATTDLRKAADRYRGTPAGNQAALALAQLLYDQGKFAEGIAAAERVSPDTDAQRASKEALIAAGLEGQRKFAEAAARYRAASGASTLPSEKAALRANEARALTAAGKGAEARAIWTELSADPVSPLADEAKIRLGELMAKPAT